MGDSTACPRGLILRPANGLKETLTRIKRSVFQTNLLEKRTTPTKEPKFKLRWIKT